MCDYSLHNHKTKLATEGEQLFVNLFKGGSQGLASCQELKTIRSIQPAPTHGFIRRCFHWISELRRVAKSSEEKFNLTAICVPPGARLRLVGFSSRLQKQWGVDADEEVTFLQETAEPFRYRDAVQFDHSLSGGPRKGEDLDIVSLQKLPVGLRVVVLSLDLEEESKAELQHQRLKSGATLGAR
jgi:hypothetical protein